MLKQWQNFHCSTCGGQLEIKGDVLVCKNCRNVFPGEEQIPEDVVIRLNNANMDKNRYAFDDALEKYELILGDYPDNAEANWGALLCSYGIMYEKDYDGTYKPTCHRVSERSIFDCPYFAKLSTENKKRAVELEELRKAILDKTKSVPPYDVFICYKATEEKRGVAVPTKESKWARDIYDLLTREMNLRVFFAEKSLVESNTEYEPHIYAALRSAKLMFVLADSVEKVNAVWVKNEWKRFTKYIREGEKKVVRVVYDSITPYDLPKELQSTQAIDHGDMAWGKEVRRAAEQAVDADAWGLSEGVEEIDGKVCVACKTVNPMQASYCKVCGCNQFAVGGVKYCRECGLKVQFETKYCMKCGSEEFVYSHETYEQLNAADEKAQAEATQQYAERKKIKKAVSVYTSVYVVLNLLLIFGYFIPAFKGIYEGFLFRSIFGSESTFWARCFSWLNVILLVLDFGGYLVFSAVESGLKIKGETQAFEGVPAHILMLVVHLIVFSCIGGWKTSAAMGGGRFLLDILAIVAYLVIGIMLVFISPNNGESESA